MQYSVASPYFTREKEPRFLCLDPFAPQMTQSLRDEFKKLNCTTSYIPGGCTGFVQVLDVSLNKVLKALVAEQASNHADKYHTKYEAGDFTVGDRRVLLTKWVAEAWDELHKKYKDTIVRTFRQVGLSLNPDGSEDRELKIKGLDNIAVGDYSRVEPEEKNGLGSLTATDIAAVEAAQVKLAARVAKAKKKLNAKMASNNTKIQAGKVLPSNENSTAKGYNSNGDAEEESSGNDEEHEEIFTLGRMNTRSQTRVSRYFTHAEVEADKEAVRVQEEKEAGLWVNTDGDESDIDDEPEFDPSDIDDDDEDFDEGRQGDDDIADENM